MEFDPRNNMDLIKRFGNVRPPRLIIESLASLANPDDVELIAASYESKTGAGTTWSITALTSSAVITIKAQSTVSSWAWNIDSATATQTVDTRSRPRGEVIGVSTRDHQSWNQGSVHFEGELAWKVGYTLHFRDGATWPILTSDYRDEGGAPDEQIARAFL